MTGNLAIALVNLLLVASCGARPDGPSAGAPGPAAERVAALESPPPLRTVEQVDLERYYGRWYEIARYPNMFQSGLVGVVAEYKPRDDGKIDVVNTGRKDSLTGPLRRSTAVAWVANKRTNAELEVQFVPLITADYWIIDLCEDYSYAVVGQPSRAHLWILSRAPRMPDETYREICARLEAQGYDPRKLMRTPQPRRPG